MPETFVKLIDCLPVDIAIGGLRSQITPATTFKSLGMDSLDLIEFVSNVEAAYSIEIPNQELKEAKFKTLGDVEAYIGTRKAS